ncbi:MAG: hypothetical protein NZO58_04820 [Gemmataceae bacterium]|nr:hypothetical protein [Gemmataceae bacterium]
MRTFLTAVVGWALVTGARAVGEEKKGEEKKLTHDAVVRNMLDAIESITRTLTTVTDQESAAAAKGELAKIAKEWLALRAAAEKLPPPPREEKDRLEKEYKGKIEAAQLKLAAEVARVRNVPGGLEALQEIRSVLTRPKS